MNDLIAKALGKKNKDDIGVLKKNRVYVEDYSNLKVAISQGYDWYAAFNAALNSLPSSGGEIIFSDEYYCSDRILITNKSNLSLIGIKKAKITFTKYTPTTPIGIDFVNCSNVSLSNLILTSLSDVGGYQFTDDNKLSGTVTPEQGNSSIVHLDNVTGFKIQEINIPFHNGFGIVVTKSKKGFIEKNIVENTWRDGIHIQDGCEAIGVYNNRVENTGDDGISVFSSGAEEGSAWLASTAYIVGQRVYANNKVYECTIAGTSSTISPSHSSGTATDGTVTWSYTDVYKVISKNIQFSYNIIKNTYNRGMWVTGENIRVTNNIIDGTAVGGIYSQSEYWTGVKTKLAKKLIIKDNTIRNIATVNSSFKTKADMWRGIFIETQNQNNTTRVSDLIVENNEIFNFTTDTTKSKRAIQLLRVKDCNIKNNNIADYSYEGINVTVSDNVTIENNKVHSVLCEDNSRGIYVDVTNNLLIVANQVDGAVSTGISTYNVTDVEISRNVIYDINPRSLTSKNGISASTCVGVKVLNNTVEKFGKLERAIKLATISNYLAIKGNVYPHKDFATYEFSDAYTSVATNVTGTTKVYAYDLPVTAPPTAGTWNRGFVLDQPLPSETGTAGSKYILEGWRNVAGGNAGTWLERRVLTGN